MEHDTLDTLREAVIRVGEGRGFLVEWPRDLTRVVITAAHCLPWLPDTAHPAAYAEDHTYANLLGPLGESLSVWAELLFVDPMADLAVLCMPDTQERLKDAEAYDELVKDRPVFRIALAPETCPGWIFSLDQEWLACTVRSVPTRRSRLGILDTTIVSGMSGSPILREDGSAMGVISSKELHPRLDEDLPGGLFAELRTDVRPEPT